jgi:hypothetical protein
MAWNNSALVGNSPYQCYCIIPSIDYNSKSPEAHYGLTRCFFTSNISIFSSLPVEFCSCWCCVRKRYIQQTVTGRMDSDNGTPIPQHMYISVYLSTYPSTLSCMHYVESQYRAGSYCCRLVRTFTLFECSFNSSLFHLDLQHNLPET